MAKAMLAVEIDGQWIELGEVATISEWGPSTVVFVLVEKAAVVTLPEQGRYRLIRQDGTTTVMLLRNVTELGLRIVGAFVDIEMRPLPPLGYHGATQVTDAEVHQFCEELRSNGQVRE